MRKFLLLGLSSALLSAIISELSFISWRYSLAFYLLLLTINSLFYLAYHYDDVFMVALKKPLKFLLIEDGESYHVAVIVTWISFNVGAIFWRWSYV